MKIKIGMSIIVAASMVATPCPAVEISSQERSPNLVLFQKDLWPGVSIPDQYRAGTHFYTSAASALTDECLRQEKPEIDRFFSGAQFRFGLGEKCGEPFIVIHEADGKNMSAAAREFVGNHENFHLIAQIFSGPTPSVLVFGPRPQYTSGSVLFLRATYDALSNVDQVNNTAIKEIVRLYKSLSPQDKYVVDYYSTVEWPAEYYAFKTMTRESAGWNFSKYLAVRSEIADEPAYEAAIPVGRALDKILGAGKWESGIFAGETMFTLLARIGLFKEIGAPEMLHVSSFPLSLSP